MKKFSLPEYFKDFIPHISLFASSSDFNSSLKVEKLNQDLKLVYDDNIVKTINVNKIFIKIGSIINTISFT